MKKSNIAQGQMFIQFPQPIPELQDTPKPRVWVKVSDADFEIADSGVSLFVDNRSLVLHSVGQLKKVGIRDKWYISDGYYGKCVREGVFVPIDDLREVEGICEELGYELPEEVEF